jgi:hypothetical protein
MSLPTMRGSSEMSGMWFHHERYELRYALCIQSLSKTRSCSLLNTRSIL